MDKNIKKQADAVLRDTWDRTLEQQGRYGPERLTDSERAELMGLALRGAVFWAVIAEIITIAAYISQRLLEGVMVQPAQWLTCGRHLFFLEETKTS